MTPFQRDARRQPRSWPRRHRPRAARRPPSSSLPSAATTSRRLGSAAAAQAAAAAARWREARPEAHPPTPHALARGPPLAAPALCRVCAGPVARRGAPTGCAACGIVVHDGCARRLAPDCKPAAGVAPVAGGCHHWRPAGGAPPPDVATERDDADAASSSVCVYCRGPAGGGVGAAPEWACAWCGAACHVACHAACHGQGELLDAPDKGASRRRRRGGARSPRSPTGDPRTPHAARPPPARPPPSLLASFLAVVAPGRVAPPPPAPTPRAGGEVAALLAARGALPSTPAALAAADACDGGPHGRLVLPPTALRWVGPAPGWADRARAAVAAAVAARRGPSLDGGGAGGACAPSPGPDAPALARPSPDRRASLGGGSWWPAAAPAAAAARAAARDPYAALEPAPGGLPAGCTPLIVVVNTKSGPQAGPTLGPALLRRLNPLQIVCVPAASPDPALRLLGRLPGARVLAVGGDGTVGWVLSCLDRIRADADAARAAARAAGLPLPPPFHPPPVAVLPLGTGNDLARVLGWGGGLAGWAAGGGVAAALAAVDTASTDALVDRWAVDVRPLQEPRAPSRRDRAAATLARVGSLGGRARRRRGSTADAEPAAPIPRHPPPLAATAPSKSLVATNYVGFGVDAKVALDFHAVREGDGGGAGGGRRARRSEEHTLNSSHLGISRMPSSA